MSLTVEHIVSKAGGPLALARLLGVSHSGVCHWQKDKQLPATRIAQIHQVLGYDVHELLQCSRQVGATPKRAVVKNPKRVSMRETTGAATP